MKFVAYTTLRLLNKDIFKLLTKVQPGVFRPFVPLKFWRSLGNEFNEKQWKRLLRRYRIKLSVVRNDSDHSITGEYDNVYDKITMEITNPEKFILTDLKFELIVSMIHEFIHGNQFHAHEDQCHRTVIDTSRMTMYDAYLCEFGEIQAFASCIALEMLECKIDTITRYNDAHPKVRRILFRQMFRWIEKYSQ